MKWYVLVPLLGKSLEMFALIYEVPTEAECRQHTHEYVLMSWEWRQRNRHLRYHPTESHFGGAMCTTDLDGLVWVDARNIP